MTEPTPNRFRIGQSRMGISHRNTPYNPNPNSPEFGNGLTRVQHHRPGEGRLPSGPTLDPTQLTIDRNLGTRNFYMLGLAFGWAVAIACITAGALIIASPPIQVPAFLLGKAARLGTSGFAWTELPDPSLPNPYLSDHRVFRMSKAGVVIVPLLLHVAITLVHSCLHAIHETTLRWALWRQGCLYRNCNLRLFSSSTGRKRGRTRWWNAPNAWPANIVSGLGLIFAYGGTTVMTFQLYITGSASISNNEFKVTPNDVTGNRHALDFNAWGLLGLGAGMLLQSVVATWSFTYAGLVVTWNANPLATARADRFSSTNLEGQSSAERRRLISPSRSIVSPSRNQLAGREHGSGQLRPYRLQGGMQPQYPTFHLPFSSQESISCAQPKFTQSSARDALPITRKIIVILWTAFALVSGWTVVVGIVAFRRKMTSAEWVIAQTERSDFLAYWQSYGQIMMQYNDDPYSQRREWIGLLIQCTVILLLLLALHAAELLVELSRDEAIWRRAASVGSNPDSSLLAENARHWPCWVIFAFKFTVPWVFGYAFSCNASVFMALLPLVALSVLFMLLAGFAGHLVRARPTGSQPATYGDIQALNALVDDWGYEKIFWGDKGKYTGGIRVAGTSGRRLADLAPGVMYIGLLQEPEGEADSSAYQGWV